MSDSKVEENSKPPEALEARLWDKRKFLSQRRTPIRGNLALEVTASNGSGEQVVFEQTVVREVVENGDGSQPLQKQAGWAGGHVAVRCVLDLGFDELKSEWLILGQIGE